jgi:hypothetical protein
MLNQRGEPRDQPAGRASQRPAQNSCNWHCGVVIVTEGSRGSARDTRRPTDDDDCDDEYYDDSEHTAQWSSGMIPGLQAMLAWRSRVRFSAGPSVYCL